MLFVRHHDRLLVMTFPEAMTAMLEGQAVRCVTWGPRRAIRLAMAPWNGVEEIAMVFDRTKPGGVVPYRYGVSGADARGEWEVTDYVAA